MEALVSYKLIFWHAFIGCAGSLNGVNVFDRSPLVHKMFNGESAAYTFNCNGTTYQQMYNLTDKIYPREFCPLIVVYRAHLMCTLLQTIRC